ncbi:MAG: hypothetical protein ACPG8W_05875 [Candidatus Promineifilaceae bacterium]
MAQSQPPPPARQTYILRMWQEADQTWRFIIDNPHTAEQQAFGKLAQVVTFLQSQTNETQD